MTSASSIEQQHQEFKRQISTHDTYPCFLLDQTYQQRFSSPASNPMPSYLSSQAFSPLARSPLPSSTTNISRLTTKPPNQYRLFPSSPSNNVTTTVRTNTRSNTQIFDVPIEKTIVPLRTMTDLFPSFSYSDMKTSSTQKSSNYSMSTINSHVNNTSGVSIFGFREEDLDSIIHQFQDIGQITRIEQPLGNFLNVIYANHVSCQNALSRDGMVFNGQMIGVVPLMNQ